jgi:hypothetical protein
MLPPYYRLTVPLLTLLGSASVVLSNREQDADAGSRSSLT